MTQPQTASLARLIGTWTTEATHPDAPGVVVHGSAVVEWLDGEQFIMIRSRTDHPDFPDATSVIGYIDQDRVDEQTGSTAAVKPDAKMRMHYYDSRGVYRDYESVVDAQSWRWSRESPGFSQRFTGTFADGGDTIVGQSQLRRDDVHWVDDLAITYRRSR